MSAIVTAEYKTLWKTAAIGCRN